MILQIEQSKSYKTRDGRKANIRGKENGGWYGTIGEESSYRSFKDDGSHIINSELDLIAEWSDEVLSPVRTETRKVIVPGFYGCVQVKSETNGDRVQLVFQTTCEGLNTWYDAEELRALIPILSQLADALESNK